MISFAVEGVKGKFKKTKEELREEQEEEETMRREERRQNRQQNEERSDDGLHLGFIQNMDPKIKHGVGLLLISSIFIILYWALKRLQAPKEIPKKKKNK